MEATINPGAAQDGEKLSKNVSGTPRPEQVIVFAPGGLQERSGADFITLKWPPGTRRGPRGSPDASGRS